MSAQTTITQNGLYLNDLTASLNEKDYVTRPGSAQLQKPFPYAVR